MNKIANDLMYDILPVVIQSDRRKRNVDEETHIYDSDSNHHAIFKRSVKTSTEANDVIDYMVVDGTHISFNINVYIDYIF